MCSWLLSLVFGHFVVFLGICVHAIVRYRNGGKSMFSLVVYCCFERCLICRIILDP